MIAAFDIAPHTAAALTLAVSNDPGSGSLRAALTAAGNNGVVDMTQLTCGTITLAKASGALQTTTAAL